MKFLSLLAALLLEQARPLRQDNYARDLFARYCAYLARHLNGGEYRHGVIAWLLAVAPVALAVLAVHGLLAHVSAPAAWLWNVAVLYLTMGLRQFSHHFTQVSEALREARIEAAREELGQWRGESAAGFGANEIARAAIELALISAHRHVFGTVACFVVAGAPGAIVYRLSALLAERWGESADPEFGAFGRFAARSFYWIDWLPVRLTAASFAIVGDFEDAAYCWRTQAASWTSEAHGILLATGGGALGVRLGGALPHDSAVRIRPEMGIGDEADVDYLRSAVGLVWRALVLWMFLILLVTIAHALG